MKKIHARMQATVFPATATVIIGTAIYSSATGRGVSTVVGQAIVGLVVYAAIVVVGSPEK